jgi:hypothetical protein
MNLAWCATNASIFTHKFSNHSFKLINFGYMYYVPIETSKAHQMCALINLGEDFCHIADYVFVNEDYNIHCVEFGHYLLIYICVALIYKLKRVSSEKCE